MSTELTVQARLPARRGQAPTIGAILARANGDGGLSIASHDVAIRRPLADLVEATITAACKSTHSARAYRRAIGEFIALLGKEHFDGAPLVERLEHGKHKETVFDYHETPAGALLLVGAALLDKFARSNAQGAHAVKTFLSVAYRDSVLTQSQAAAMGLRPYQKKTQRRDAPVGRRLSVMEVQFLRAAVDAEAVKGKRDLAILDLALFAGLRRQEVAELRLSDFRQDSGRWVLVFSGKGDKTRRVAVHKVLYASLTDWLAAYGHALGDDAPAFARVRKGGAIIQHAVSSQAVSDLVAAYGHKAGLSSLTGDGRLTPHDARRTFARRLHDCGASLAAIQRLLGHADVKTTILYVGLDEVDAQDAVDLLTY